MAAGIDEIWHLTVGSSIVREHLIRGVGGQDRHGLLEVHVAQAGLGHLIGPLFSDVVALHRGGVQQLAAGDTA
ncbi:hypothetical protein LWC34_12570 [Kibdelosporangium philippinense]|uniref:Uncharacterized protein n=1 Tax=Kibdelosporangium philippinense TaxID=211113 RepID=A0ABS8Z6Z6_9PSEU|nr:hypothetical protein [Kibdelosporangium philippinense]MCE7003653.1 hypothetical protein [Kibdelosporangium philippinense]